MTQPVSHSKHVRGDDTPLVSVIIPTYKAAAYIGDALKSVFCQTYRNFEVILINDGSPDTEELGRAIAPYRNEICYFSQPNRGPSAARNTGIREARGEYLAFLDSDDLWYPTCLAAQVALALSLEPSCDLVYSDLLVCLESPQASSATPSGIHRDTLVRRAARLNGGTIRYSQICPSNGSVTFASLLREDCKPPTSCTMVRRQAAIAAGLFDENIRHAEDYDMWLRIAHTAPTMTYGREVLGKHRIVPDSLSHDDLNVLAGIVSVLTKLSKQPNLSASELSALESKLLAVEAQLKLEQGKTFLLDGKYGEAIAALRQAELFLPGIKLRAALLGLRVAPRVMQAIVGAWAAQTR